MNHVHIYDHLVITVTGIHTQSLYIYIYYMVIETAFMQLGIVAVIINFLY